jgi:dephospho-CoA kinase
MLIIGLTGSIAMGKSTTAAMFGRLGIPVHDADATVHRLMARGGAAVSPVERAFPGVVVDGMVDRKRLATRVFGDPAALNTLEAILHPLVAKQRDLFLRLASRRRHPLVVLDVPLLFETGTDRVCDIVAVVSAPAFVQRDRLRRRPAMDEARIKAIVARQMSDAEKRKRADVVIPSGLGRAPTLAALRRLIADLRGREGRAWRTCKELRRIDGLAHICR